MMLIGSLKFPAILPQIMVLTEKLQTPLVMEERSNEQTTDVIFWGLNEQLPQSVSMLYCRVGQLDPNSTGTQVNVR